MKTFIFTNGVLTEPITANNITDAWDKLKEKVGDTSNWELSGGQG